MDRINKGDQDRITGLFYFPEEDMVQYCFEVEGEDDLSWLPDEPWIRLNHSENPNCVVWDDMTIEAIRDIDPGEEVFIDYGYTP